MSRRFNKGDVGSGMPFLIISLVVVFAAGVILAFASWLSTSLDGGYFHRRVCLLNSCIENYAESFAYSAQIAKSTIDLCVAIATVGGIFVALLSYINSVGNNALINHIEHLKLFSENLESEVAKRDRLRGDLFDKLLFYSKIFPGSRRGDMSVSGSYKDFISRLNRIIEESNAQSKNGAQGGFSYRGHQKKVRDLFSEAGITVYLAPRNDYMAMEEQLFSLIDRINQSFCPAVGVAVVAKVLYH